MKLNLIHHNHAPTKTIIEMIQKELQSLKPDLQIDEAKVHLEHSLTDSPPFKTSFHLVTPGPDVLASATDHTLRAAVLKAFRQIADKIEHRHEKRSRRREIEIPSVIRLIPSR